MNKRALPLLALCAAPALALATGGALGQTPDASQSGGATILRGGAVRGAVKNAGPGLYEIEPTLGGRIVVSSDEVKQTTTLRKEQIEYRNFAPLQPDTVEARLKVAKWASERKLSAQADEQYRRVVELDPDNEEARKALNHVKENGVWVSKKEQMERRGLERYGGRDVSKQEADLLRARDAEKKEVARWRKETEALYRAAKNDDQSAADRLRRVKNPYALATLVKLYQGEKNDAEGRVLLVQAMGSIGTPAALGRLGTIALKDEDLDVRSAAIRGIDRKKLARDEAIEFFRRNLRESGDIATINRAAYALGELKAEQAIPDLVNSLITSHKRQVVVGSQQTGMTVDSSGGVSGFSPGGGGKTKTVVDRSMNETVRNALVAIVAANYQTPVDFGYDVEAWIAWKRSVDQLGAFYPRRDR